jgi:hypothetical protein
VPRASPRQEAARHGTSHVADLIEHHDSERRGDEPKTGIALQRFKSPGVSASSKIRNEERQAVHRTGHLFGPWIHHEGIPEVDETFEISAGRLEAITDSPVQQLGLDRQDNTLVQHDEPDREAPVEQDNAGLRVRPGARARANRTGGLDRQE